jgi:hypothetical protein
MRDALHLTKFANFGRRWPGLGTGFRRPAGCEKQLQMPPPPHHHMRSACQSHVCMIFGVVTSPEASCGATWRSRRPSCTKRCVHPQLDIKGASICCRGRGYVSTSTKQGPDGTGLPLSKLGIEICWGSATTAIPGGTAKGHAPHCTPKTAVSTPLHAPLSTRLDEISLA